MRCFEIKEAFQTISSLSSNNMIWNDRVFQNQLLQEMRSILELIGSNLDIESAEKQLEQASASEQIFPGIWIPELLQTLGAEIGSLELLLDEAVKKTDHGENISTERIEIAKTADFLAAFAFLTCIKQDWLGPEA